MKLSEKRTRTEPGLGKVSADARRTSTRGRAAGAASDSERVGQPVSGASPGPPISGPPPSGGPASGPPGARHTRAIESSRPREGEPLESLAADDDPKPPVSSPRSHSPVDPRADTQPPPMSERAPLSTPIDRSERDDDRGHKSGERTPIDVTHVDTKRLPRPTGGRDETKPFGERPDAKARPGAFDSRPILDRFEAEEHPTGRRPIGGRAPSREPASGPKPGSRTVDGRPISNRPADAPRARPPSNRPVNARPASSRPAPSSNRPSKRRGDSLPPPPSAATGTARSKRVSIREDNLGDGIHRAPEVVAGGGPSSRSVPRLLKSKAEIAAAPIDHRAGFLLAHIDGTTNVQGLVDIAGMAENEVHEILERLRRLGIVAIR
jgi:hypothetical protein